MITCGAMKVDYNYKLLLKIKTYLKLYSIRLIRKILSSRFIYNNKLYAFWIRKRSKNKVEIMEGKHRKDGVFSPISIEIELTNICNVSCVFCPNPVMKRSKGVMTFETFRNIIDELKKLDSYQIIISGFGEPLLDKNITEKLYFLKKNTDCAKIMLVTNGVLLNSEFIQYICKEQLVDTISISVDAADGVTWEKIHGFDLFNKVEQNIYLIDRIKRRSVVSKPKVDLRYKDFSLNKGNAIKFINKFYAYVDNIHFYSNICQWPGSKIDIESINKDKLIKVVCPNLWEGIKFNWNGDAVMCPQDYEGRFVLGNVNCQPLRSFWNSKKIQHYRLCHKDFKFDQLEVCDNCDINTHMVIPI